MTNAHKPNPVVQYRLLPNTAEARIRGAAKDTSNVTFSEHAIDRMEERGLSDIQVLDILRTGFVLEQPKMTEYGEWKCKITKELRGRREAGVITIILHSGRLFLVTVEWEDVK